MTAHGSDPGTARTAPCPACGGDGAAQAERLAGLLRDDALDAAIEAGLMDFVSCPECAAGDVHADAHARIAEARQRLREAWAARERHRARTARLQRRATERAAKRAIPAARGPERPALPPAAAAALARARARAAGQA